MNRKDSVSSPEGGREGKMPKVFHFKTMPQNSQLHSHRGGVYLKRDATLLKGGEKKEETKQNKTKEGGKRGGRTKR